MSWKRWVGTICAAHGAIAVAAGAFAAHAAADPRAIELLQTGARWQVVAALAGVLACARGAPASGGLFTFGGVVFAGSLYGLALGAPSWLGAVTPIGGLALIAGWGALAAGFARGDREAAS